MARVYCYASSNRKHNQSALGKNDELSHLSESTQAPSPAKAKDDYSTLDVTAVPGTGSSASSSLQAVPPASSTVDDRHLATLPAITAALLQQQQQQYSGDLDMMSAVAAIMNTMQQQQQQQQQRQQQQQQQQENNEDFTQDKKGKRPESATNELMEPALQLLGLAQGGGNDRPASETAAAAATAEGTSKENIESGAAASNVSDGSQAEENKPGQWTAEEDELLVEGIKRFGYGRWEEIESIVPGRTSKQLKQRWDQALASKYVDSEWLQSKIKSEEEQVAPKKNEVDWNEIAQKLTEKAREGSNGTEISFEALLSQALLETTPGTGSSEQHRQLSLTDAALLLYAHQLAQQQQQQQQAAAAATQQVTSGQADPTANDASSSLSYLLPNAFSGNEQAVVLAAAAAVAAMAGSNNNGTANAAATAAGASRQRTTQGRYPSAPRKRRRSDPALADTQSAAMSIYASSAPITTKIDDQIQTVYPCLFPGCGKTFARLYNLKSHSRTHTDDRPFVCSFCQAAFARNHDLKRHSKIHGQEKPYQCQGCNKYFSRLDALKRHKKNQRNKPACML